MKQNDFFRLVLMLFALCGLSAINVYGDNHWTYGGSYPDGTVVIAAISIDGTPITDASAANFELAAFSTVDHTCRSSERPIDLMGDGVYLAMLTVMGTDGEEIYFKVYDHTAGREYEAGMPNITIVDMQTLGLDDDGFTPAPILTAVTTSEITIITQPADATLTEGSISGSLTVAASATNGATLSYEWFANTSNSNSGGTATGSTAATFAIPTGLTAGTYYYYCAVSATNAVDVASNVATVTVNPAAPAGIAIDAVNFPDANFRTYLLTQTYGSDAVLTAAEIAAITTVSVGNKSIADLTGIGYFTSLTDLLCSNNQLTSLPALPASLTFLSCFNNQLTSLPALPASLGSLLCSDNLLTSLPALPASLIQLSCNDNLLTSLPALPASLGWLYCQNNQLTSLPATLPVLLRYLICGVNQLTSLPALPASLGWLDCQNNQLTSLDLSGLNSLISFSGDFQTVPLTLTGNVTDGYTLSIALNTPTFGDAAVTYTGGTLTSTDNTVSSTSFTVQTGNASYALSGTLNLTYQAPTVAVTNITGIPATATAGTPLVLAGTVVPANATNKNITWSVKDAGTTNGYISTEFGHLDGLPYTKQTFETSAPGTAVITATITNGIAVGSDYTQDFSITVNAATPTGIAINATNFPNANFRNYLLGETYGADAVLTDTEIAAITTMDVSSLSIADLTGIGYFTALTELDCNNNLLTSLPALPASLTWLDCKYNQIASLPALPSSLAYLDCNNNQIASLPALPASLAWLDCNNNQLTSLPALPASLEELCCAENQLASLPATLPSTSLTQLYCNNNQLTSLPDLPASLTYLDCYNNRLTSLPDLPSSLAYLACFNNQLASLPSLPASLEMLDCYNNQLALLPALPASLIELYCSENQLTSLPALPASLTWLYCYDNQIASLPALPTSLAILYCNDNQLASLDLSGLTSLTTFNGSGQTVPLTLTGNVTDGYTLNIALNTPTFGNAAVTYTGGTLTSTDNTVASTSFTVQTGNASYALSGTLNLTYQDAAPAVAPAITTTSLSGGTVGTAYSRTLAATGDAPITWSITVGNLPGGLSLNASTGEISGTPTAANTFNFTVRATNGAGNDTKALSIAVIPAFVAVTNITNVPTSATAGTPLTLTGTVSPANATNQTITWSVKTAGTTGATVSGSALNTTAAGTVVVTATIANGLTATTDYTQDFTITVNKSTFTATVIMNGWVYGETANNPGVSNNPGNATVAYYYDTNIHGSFTSTVKPTDAGIYYVKAVIAESANYQGYTTQPDDFVISVAHLNVAWGSTGFTYNGTSQSPFAYVTLANHTTIYLDVTGGAVDAGTYTATASTSNPNIVPTGNTSTTYTISPAEQTISIDFSRLNHNPTRLDIINPLRATSPSGLPVQFRLRPEDAAIAEIDANNNLIFKQNGTVIVTATAPGNNNYLPASPVEITFVMNDRTGNESIELKAVTIYPNPITSGLLYIKNAKPGAKIEIYTLSGSLAGIYTATDTITTIDFSRFTSGTYIIKTGQTTLKVIKK